MAERKNQNLLSGALILVVATALVKIISAIYKIPVTNLIGGTGMGYYSVAYKIYLPIWSISMAGLPVAVSKMISEKAAVGRFNDVKRIFSVSLKVFLLTGTAGTALLMAVAYPYAVYVAKAPETISVILCVAPAIFFCCVMSAYRGYYEGLRNMLPTALSQVIEAVAKLVIGLSFSYAVVRIGIHQFETTGVVFGKAVENMNAAMAVIYPYAACGAILGVTAGTIASFLYLFIKLKIGGYGFSKDELFLAPAADSDKVILKSLIALAIPVVISSLISNISTLIDAATVQNRLAYAIAHDSGGIINSIYSKSLSIISDSSISSIYLYGCFDVAETLKNLVPQITLTLGVSSLPALAQYWSVNDEKNIRISVESVFRVCLLIALPVGFGMAVLPQQILALLYGSSQPDIQYAVPKILSIYGFTMALYAISSPLTTMLQAIGKAKIPAISFGIACAVKIVLNYILVANPRFNILGAAISTVVCYMISVLVNLIYFFRYTKVKVNVMSILIKPLISSVLCAAAAWATNGLLGKILSIDSRVITCASILVAGVVYVLALLVTKSIAKDDVLMLPKGEKIAKVLEKIHCLG